jgi:poly(A) polymerase
VGKSFGVLKVPIEGVAYPLEIATFREDLDYKDHRHPQGVRFSGPYEDAQRRDFTINALFYDAKTNRILDSAEGMEDLRKKIVRAIGEPDQRFKEDALRLLRAVRFSTSLGFALDEKTASAIRGRAKLVSAVSFERIRDEISGMLQGPHPALALEQLSKLGLLRAVLPEVEAMKGVKSPVQYEGDVWKHALKIIETYTRQNPKRSLTESWAIILHNVGKVVAAQKSGNKNFNEHEVEAARIARSVCDRMKLSRAESDEVIELVGDQLKFRDVFKMREATLQRFVREPAFEKLLAIHRAEAMASDGNLAFYEFCRSKLTEYRKSQATGESPKLLDGNDLIQLGLSPGKDFSEILKNVEDLAFERKLHSKEEALEYVVKNFVK